MSKQVRVWTGTQWDTLAVTLPDLSNYSTTTQMNTAIDDAKGLVHINTTSFSAASAVNVNNCFSSTYSNYRIICNITACSVNDQNLGGRMRASGTDNSTTNYQRSFIRVINGSVSGGFDTLSEFLLGQVNTTVGLVYAADFVNPFAAAPTKILNTFMSGSTGTTAVYAANTMVYHNVSSSFDGFSFFPSSGTITGVVKVYGYQD